MPLISAYTWNKHTCTHRQFTPEWTQIYIKSEMYTQNGIVWYPFCLPVSGMKTLAIGIKWWVYKKTLHGLLV